VKLVSPERHRQAVEAARDKYHLSERTACRIVGQPLGTQRYVPTLKPDEDELTRNIVLIAANYGRYGYRRVTAMLNDSGIMVGKDRVQLRALVRHRSEDHGERRREGLRVPQKQPKRSRLWLNDGSCIRLRPEHPNHVWSFDFVEAATHDGRRIRLMTLIDECTRKCLAIRVARRINAIGVIETLADAMLFEGVPAFIRWDNGREMIAMVLRQEL
jgi:putative transposase